MKISPFVLGMTTGGHRCSECGELLSATGGFTIVFDAGVVLRLCVADAGELGVALVPRVNSSPAAT